MWSPYSLIVFFSLQGFVYRDHACYSYSLNHAVLVVGYLIVGTDPNAASLAPPFGIIRNSWGTGWGDGGYMRMGIEGGDGICGINVLPPLYPVVKSKQECVQHTCLRCVMWTWRNVRIERHMTASMIKQLDGGWVLPLFCTMAIREEGHAPWPISPHFTPLFP